jgi:hypothetical protein
MAVPVDKPIEYVKREERNLLARHTKLNTKSSFTNGRWNGKAHKPK